jgi:hypothetical protein
MNDTTYTLPKSALALFNAATNFVLGVVVNVCCTNAAAARFLMRDSIEVSSHCNSGNNLPAAIHTNMGE